MPEERLLTLCAALLHDLGHGPFSHSIEEAFEMDHEDWTCRIILEDTEITAILRDVAEDFPDKVASVISKTYEHEIVVNLVSGPLDADRMDYLLRDAYYTGVNYGTIDIDRILRMLSLYGRVVVKESGCMRLRITMSRYQMYWQVYFHPVTRSSEIILRQILRRAKELVHQQHAFRFMIEPLSDLFSGEVTVGQYLLLDEALMQTAFMQWTLEEDDILSDLCSRFIHRKLYKYVEMEHLDSDTIDESAAASPVRAPARL